MEGYLEETGDIEKMVWPQLYGTTSTGDIKTWRIFVYKENGSVAIGTLHGKLHGKLIEQKKLVKTGKNIGKSNETTPWEQALSEAQSTFQGKLDKKYIREIPNGKNESDAILPMLAQDYRKRAHDIVFPAYVQPKFNGVRCLARRVGDSIEFTSKKCKSYNDICQHLVPQLLEVMADGAIWDGELYVHGWSFQKILKTTKKLRPWGHELEYHVYDVANDNSPFRERFTADLIGDGTEINKNIKIVATKPVNDEGQIKKAHDAYVQDGYEGVIIRNSDGQYKFDHRSKDLQKYKEFIDEEFKITGFTNEPVIITDAENGTTVEANAIIFICRDKNGKEFNVRPKGSIKDRIAWFANGEGYLGKDLTVRYQNLSDDGTPIFPVGIAIRDYE
jgi:DNA ligase-1